MKETYNEIQQKTGRFVLNIEKSPVDERDFIAESIYSPEVDVPRFLDLRPFLSPVVNQGPQGTCSAQVAKVMKEYQEYKLQGLTGDEALMSAQFVYNFREEPNYEGMTPRETMKILQKTGICRELIYPYGTIQYPSNIPQIAIDDAQNFQIEAYAQIDTQEGLKKALVKDGVCYICFPVYNESSRMWKPDQGQENMGGHAMAVVGYNSKGFIIRNSWGVQWGDNGHTIYPYEDWGAHWEIWTTLDMKSAWPDIDVSEFKQPIKTANVLFTASAILLGYYLLTK
jgi:C1A family cysteine protease